jgi:hypothetical protein
MLVHGVDEVARADKANMQFLYEQVKKADRIINY